VAYNGRDKFYANNFTTSACMGKGNFAVSTTPPITSISRKEGCAKGAAYLNVWMYIIHAMEKAVSDCYNSVAPGISWDEAVGFYTGSTPLLNPTTNYGVFQFGLAEKYCPLFNTCGSSGDNAKYYKSTVNEKVFSLFDAGNRYMYSNKCDSLQMTKEALVKQLAVPLLQGVMLKLYQSETDKLEKSKAELWAFASSVLPLVNAYSPSVAATLLQNAKITNVAAVPSGRAAVKASLESMYSAMGITCSDVGGVVDVTTKSGYAVGMEPCMDNSVVGYKVSNDVTQHQRLDLDLKAMQTSLGLTPPDFDAAHKMYSKGTVRHETIRLNTTPHHTTSIASLLMS
jgi:hypothetical protein